MVEPRNVVPTLELARDGLMELGGSRAMDAMCEMINLIDFW